MLQYILGGSARVHWHDLAFFDPLLFENLRQTIVDPALLENADLTFTINTTAEEVRGLRLLTSFDCTVLILNTCSNYKILNKRFRQTETNHELNRKFYISYVLLLLLNEKHTIVCMS